MNNIFAQLPRNPFVSSNGFCINKEDEKIICIHFMGWLFGRRRAPDDSDRSRLFPVYQLNLLLIRSNTKTNSIFVQGFWLKCNCFVCLLMLWYILICVWSHHLVRSHSCIIFFTLKSWPNNSEYMRGINWMKSKYWSFTNCWNLISKGLLFIYQDCMDHHPKKNEIIYSWSGKSVLMFFDCSSLHEKELKICKQNRDGLWVKWKLWKM